MAAHMHLKNDFTEDEKYHNLMTWLINVDIVFFSDFLSGMVPVSRATLTQNHNSARFCFDIDPFVSPCGCDVGYVSCLENPCQTTSCPSWPEATCRIDFCGECKARWYLNGVEKDCYEERGGWSYYDL